LVILDCLHNFPFAQRDRQRLGKFNGQVGYRLQDWAKDGGQFATDMRNEVMHYLKLEDSMRSSATTSQQNLNN
jgi:hypothetical protein